MIRLALVHVAPFISLYMFTMMFEEIRVCMAQGHEEQEEARHYHEQQQGQSMIIMGMGNKQEQSTNIIIKSMSNSSGAENLHFH